MRKFFVPSIAVLYVLPMTFCASQGARVMRMENGINKAEFTNPNKETTKNKVLDAANHFCESEAKHAVVVKENTTYSGTFDEKSSNAIKTAGVIGGIFGSTQAEDTSAAATDDSKYTTVLMFKCE